MPAVSVVVPVYNMKNYLQRCVDGLLQQTLSDLQIILMDDGSNDGSGVMCDDLALLYGNVESYHQKNAGLTAAWKAGSSYAKGEYIGYVDADDYIDRDMFQRLYERAKETDADMVCCGLEHLYEEDPEKSWTEESTLSEDTYDEEGIKGLLSGSLINDGSFMGRPLLVNRVTKLVKRELVLQNMSLCADAVSIGEDVQFTLAMLTGAKKLALIKDYYPYHYYMQPSSMTMHYDAAYMDKINTMRRNLIRIARDSGYPAIEQQIWNDFLCLTVMHVKAIVCKQKKTPYATVRKEMEKVLRSRSVMWALGHAKMPRLALSVRLFLELMKWEWYPVMYLIIRVWFKE
ncbi:MAG: glycosyltransferase [Lachnospiraceae bacterium]|nr:glycosyltransferase [Lachnospiraceae bacterium]